MNVKSLLLFAALGLAASASSHAASSTALIHDFHIALEDLDPGDGIAASVTFAYGTGSYGSVSITPGPSVTVDGAAFGAPVNLSAVDPTGHATALAAAQTLAQLASDTSFLANGDALAGYRYEAAATLQNLTPFEFSLTPHTRVSFSATAEGFADLGGLPGIASSSAFLVVGQVVQDPADYNPALTDFTSTGVGFDSINGDSVTSHATFNDPQTVSFSNTSSDVVTGFLGTGAAVSGEAYISAVPEPEASALLLWGLALVFMRTAKDRLLRTSARSGYQSRRRKGSRAHKIETIIALSLSLVTSPTEVFANDLVVQTYCAVSASKFPSGFQVCPGGVKHELSFTAKNLNSESSDFIHFAVHDPNPYNTQLVNLSSSLTAKATAEYGSLGVYVYSGISVIANGGPIRAEANSTARYDDDLYVAPGGALKEGDIVPFHTAITFDQSWGLEAHAYPPLLPTFRTTLRLSLSHNGYGALDENGNISQAYEKSLSLHTDPLQTFDYYRNVRVGDTIHVTSYVEATAYSALYNPSLDTPDTNSSFVDSYHTTHSYFDLGDSAASLIASSGHSYMAPVPEPSTLLLSGAGGVVLLVARNRARARHRTYGIFKPPR